MKTGNSNNRGLFASLIGEKTPSKTSGALYSVSACAFFLVSLFVLCISGDGDSQWFLYASFLAAPVAFALSVWWYFSYTKLPVREFAREQKCHSKYYLVALLLQIGLFSFGELNGLFLRFLEKFGYQGSDIVLPSLDGFGFFGAIVAIAVLPAVMEELFFRGIFLREMKDFSLLAQVLLCGAVFALYHQNPAQTAYQFVCGVCFALVAARSGSFLPTVLSHFINNALILVLYKFGITSFEGGTYAIILVLSGICLIGTLGYLLFFDGKKEEKTKTKEGAFRQFFTCAILGLITFGLTWIATLLTGF